MSPRTRKLCSRPDPDTDGGPAVATLEPPTFETIQRARIAERLVEYREHVAKAAAGNVSADELGRAGDILTSLGIPLAAWDEDVAAFRLHAEIKRAEAAALAEYPRHEERARVLAAEIVELEEKLAAAKLERNDVVNVRVLHHVGLSRRANELEQKHAHLFRDPDTAARQRLDILSRKRTAATFAEWGGT